ncbi:hypothetical protein BU15DRAFT_64297 [Melanogaster broomeanus]|nr:hypothetical protein BU15DRAFT_64297 [Melanogaster broomeanus]
MSIRPLATRKKEIRKEGKKGEGSSTRTPHVHEEWRNIKASKDGWAVSEARAHSAWAVYEKIGSEIPTPRAMEGGDPVYGWFTIGRGNGGGRRSSVPGRDRDDVPMNKRHKSKRILQDTGNLETIVHKTISQEERYVRILTPSKWSVTSIPLTSSMLTHDMHQLFIRPLRSAAHITLLFKLHEFTEDVFRNIFSTCESATNFLSGRCTARGRLESIITDVFHIFPEIHGHHRELLGSTARYPARGAPNNQEYHGGTYRIDDEMANNSDFQVFVERCTRNRNPDHLDMKNSINRPVLHLSRYELLLKSILEERPAGHEDRKAIPQAPEIIKSLGDGRSHSMFLSLRRLYPFSPWVTHLPVPVDVHPTVQLVLSFAWSDGCDYVDMSGDSGIGDLIEEGSVVATSMFSG